MHVYRIINELEKEKTKRGKGKWKAILQSMNMQNFSKKLISFLLFMKLKEFVQKQEGKNQQTSLYNKGCAKAAFETNTASILTLFLII